MRRMCQTPDLTEESRPNTATGAPMNTGTAYAAPAIFSFSFNFTEKRQFFRSKNKNAREPRDVKT